VGGCAALFLALCYEGLKFLIDYWIDWRSLEIGGNILPDLAGAAVFPILKIRPFCQEGIVEGGLLTFLSMRRAEKMPAWTNILEGVEADIPLVRGKSDCANQDHRCHIARTSEGGSHRRLATLCPVA
jgi:hypothetical protein